jgi:hypothetical protein
MNAQQLIESWDILSNQEYSDLPLSVEETDMVEKIVNHYRGCASCRTEFDVHVSEDIHMISDIVWKHRASTLEDWICNIQKF